MSACYDLRFPELYRAYAAVVRICCWCRRPLPTPPARPTGRCCCAHAPSRTCAFVLAAAQGGVHPSGRQASGPVHPDRPLGRGAGRAWTQGPGAGARRPRTQRHLAAAPHPAARAGRTGCYELQSRRGFALPVRCRAGGGSPCVAARARGPPHDEHEAQAGTSGGGSSSGPRHGGAPVGGTAGRDRTRVLLAGAPSANADAPTPMVLSRPRPADIRMQPRSRWVAGRTGSELPGFAQDDALFEAWSAWLQAVANGHASLGLPTVSRMCVASALPVMRPARLDAPAAPAVPGRGTARPQQRLAHRLLRAAAASQPGCHTGLAVPLYRAPLNWVAVKHGITRSELETLPSPGGTARPGDSPTWPIPWMRWWCGFRAQDRCVLTEPGERAAGALGLRRDQQRQPYRSVGRWLLTRVWCGMRPGRASSALAANPQREQELLWSNPRVVFDEEAMTSLDAEFQPKACPGRGADAGALHCEWTPPAFPTARPSGWPVPAPKSRCERLVLAQDTGSAITGRGAGGLLCRLGRCRPASWQAVCASPCRCRPCGRSRPDHVTMPNHIN